MDDSFNHLKVPLTIFLESDCKKKLFIMIDWVQMTLKPCLEHVIMGILFSNLIILQWKNQ